MFTGIVEEVGSVIESISESNNFRISCSFNIEQIAIGASICCDGICLTVSKKGKTPDSQTWFEANVSDETKRLTNIQCAISPWSKGKEINLERSLKVGDELGGHIVTGHVDGIGILKNVEIGENSHSLTVEVPRTLMQYIAKKGSIALSGTSLTVNETGFDWIKLNLIPHTNEITNWKNAQLGQMLNIEVDLLSRYVAQIVNFRG